nr:MAG: hypothetical protein DIU59_08120 [Pseudomonadota bacterium]
MQAGPPEGDLEPAVPDLHGARDVLDRHPLVVGLGDRQTQVEVRLLEPARGKRITAPAAVGAARRQERAQEACELQLLSR